MTNKLSDVKVVIGAGFGDEGKGRVTSSFVTDDCIVVRANGGAQAGHTVVHNGVRHVFSHFGAGTLQGAPTYLAKKFIVNPLLFRKEWGSLAEKGVTPKVFIHKDAIVTTPWDMLLNQITEIARGEDAHGSCGLGISETVVRNGKEVYLRLKVKDLLSGSLLARRCDFIMSYFYDEVKERGLQRESSVSELIDTASVPAVLFNFFSDVEFMLSKVELVDDDTLLLDYERVIFEGAQGLLLDENFDLFQPHTTHSCTGSDNPLEILQGLGVLNNENVTIEICYVTRAYATRHGNGAFPTEADIHTKYPTAVCKTNTTNQFQGSLRYGYLDLTLLGHMIEKDIRKSKKYENVIYAFVMTCVDQLGGGTIKYALRDSVLTNEREYIEWKVDGFLHCLRSFIEPITKVYVSTSEEGDLGVIFPDFEDINYWGE